MLTTDSKAIAEELSVQQYGNLCFFSVCVSFIHLPLHLIHLKLICLMSRHANLCTVLTVGTLTMIKIDLQVTNVNMISHRSNAVSLFVCLCTLFFPIWEQESIKNVSSSSIRLPCFLCLRTSWPFVANRLQETHIIII